MLYVEQKESKKGRLEAYRSTSQNCGFSRSRDYSNVSLKVENPELDLRVFY